MLDDWDKIGTIKFRGGGFALMTAKGWQPICPKAAATIFELRGIEVMLNKVRDGANVHAVENHRNVCMGFQGLLAAGEMAVHEAMGAINRAKDFLRKYPDRLRPKTDEAAYPQEPLK